MSLWRDIWPSDIFWKKMKAWGANQSIGNSFSVILPLNYCFQADVMGFLLERILVGRVNSVDQINLVVTCTADCTCHHLTKNVYFFSEMWNLKQITDIAIVNVDRFANLTPVFPSWAKITTAWLYVTLAGHITIRHILEKMKAWAANQSI